MKRHLPGDRRRRLQRHPSRGQADRAGDRARPRRAAVGQPVLQPAEPPRDRRPLPRGRARHRPADRALQHPAADRRRTCPTTCSPSSPSSTTSSASSRPTRTTSPRSTGSSIYAGNDDMLVDVLDLGEAGGILTCTRTSSARRCAAWSTNPSAGERSMPACTTSTAIWVRPARCQQQGGPRA